jgi:AcrR family transcriptional regulator
MVKPARRRARAAAPPPPPTRDRLLDAAREEFAARGFDGAKVERIVRRARVNKAMLYYHFPSKAALYVAILGDQFTAVADAVQSVRRTGAPPDEQLRQFIDRLAQEALARPHFPPLWLREIADGGRHLDAMVIGEIRRVVETLAAILAEGRASGVFRDAHPFVVQIGIVAPLMFFAATRPLRQRVGRLVPAHLVLPDLEVVVRHLQSATLSVLLAGPAAGPAPSRRSRS